MDSPLTWPMITQHLLELVQQKASGTFFIATDDNASCRIGLDQGQLTHCTFRRQHGTVALRMLSDVRQGRYSFTPAPFPFRPPDAVDPAAAQQFIATLGRSDSGHGNLTQAQQEHQPRYYRGQKVEPEDSPKETKAQPPSESQQQPQKKPRYYRGQLIE